MPAKAVIPLIFLMALTSAQLNFEGNPLTENTEYTAEESQTQSRSSRQELQRAEQRPQRLYPAVETTENERKSEGIALRSSNSTSIEQNVSAANRTSSLETSRQLQRTIENPTEIRHQEESSVNPADVALTSFLNSKTPEESRLSLDYYLKSQFQQGGNANQQRPADQVTVISQPASVNQRQVLQQQQEQTFQASPQILQNQNLQTARNVQQQHVQTLSEPISSVQVVQGVQELYPQAALQQRQQYLQISAQQQQYPQISPQQQRYLQASVQQQQQQQYLQASAQQQHLSQIFARNDKEEFTTQHHEQPGQQVFSPQGFPTTTNARQGLLPVNQNVLQRVALPANAPQARQDFLPAPGWRQRNKRIRGYPPWMAQSRIGPGYFKGPIPGPFKHKPPVEVIYTKPPGFHSGPVVPSNPPVHYEDASAWFPEADYPPPSKDVYYSQLYAQSYDPHYYNYIAKTGKIKPWLYGKLDKHHREGDSIWSELFSGFKKHGLKNMMSPGFLLGMTIPTAIALMLTAFGQKRSFARSDSREFSQENVIEEYFERVRKAVECYERKNRRRANETIDGC